MVLKGVAMRLDQKYALITGGAAGIGKAMALRFAQEGAHVCTADMDETGGGETARLVERMGRKALAIKTDVADAARVKEMVAGVMAAWGRIDILVNNAGNKHANSVTDTPDELWRRILAVHLDGTFYCCREVVPHMVAAGGGKIINIASIVGKLAIANRGAYTTAKGGIAAFTRELAWELGGANINVNAIAPGFVAVATQTMNISNPRVMEGILAMTPKRRLGQPEDIANTALFLASEEADFVNGVVLTVDGGWTAGKEPLAR